MGGWARPVALAWVWEGGRGLCSSCASVCRVRALGGDVGVSAGRPRRRFTTLCNPLGVGRSTKEPEISEHLWPRSGHAAERCQTGGGALAVRLLRARPQCADGAAVACMRCGYGVGNPRFVRSSADVYT